MGLIAQLVKQKDVVTQSWFERVINTYPPETARFLNGQKDPFANPVGQTTHRSLTILVDLLGKGLDSKAARQALDPIIRIRAIQSFTASQATAFIFELKQVIRTKCNVKPEDHDEMARIDGLIDQMALIAFDLYMQCREKIYDLKANETKQRTYKAFAKAGLIKESEDD